MDTAFPTQILPSAAEIAERIRLCRQELAALCRLQRLSQATTTAERARASREAIARGLTKKEAVGA
jgi:hypothetical protein